jgi:hypothetical protein
VTGLGPADFVVLDDGKPRPVAVFRFDGGWAAPAPGTPAATLPAGTFTNRPAVSDAAPRTGPAGTPSSTLPIMVSTVEEGTFTYGLAVASLAARFKDENVFVGGVHPIRQSLATKEGGPG